MKIYNNLNKIRYNNILWVDDHPEWNHNEKLAFETMGIKITWSMNNIDALNKIETENFNLVISDLFSDDGQPKGFDLLKEIKIRNVKVSLYLTAASVDARNGATPFQASTLENYKISALFCRIFQYLIYHKFSGSLPVN